MLKLKDGEADDSLKILRSGKLRFSGQSYAVLEEEEKRRRRKNCNSNITERTAKIVAEAGRAMVDRLQRRKIVSESSLMILCPNNDTWS